MRMRPVYWLLLVNLGLSLYIFRGALTGHSLLAPLNLPAHGYSKYGFVQPTDPADFANYGLNDQLIYDLPIHLTIHRAYRRGEIPWWDPYGFAGRPLLADGHISGTDPVRVLCNLALPFEWAYNWTRILHFWLSGLGLFLLLRHWRFAGWLCVLLGLTYEFCGSHAVFFGYPWLQASFWYYPFLWLVFDQAMTGKCGGRLGLVSLLVAGIFYSGNLQSHTYLVFFLSALVLGYGHRSWAQWKRAVAFLAPAAILGFALAAPVLLNQLEFFAVGIRKTTPPGSAKSMLTGLASLTTVYPWMLGTFETVDLRNYFFRATGLGQNYNLGYHTFIGSAAFVLALMGAFLPARNPLGAVRRTALWSVAFFFLILSSPLLTILYTRSSGLAVLGLIVLAGLGLETIAAHRSSGRLLGWSVLALALLLAAGTHVAALKIFPRYLPKVRQMLQDRDQARGHFDDLYFSPETRLRQLEAFPREVTFKNPETVGAFISLLLLAGLLLSTRARAVGWLKPVLLAVNLLPVIWYCQRSVPVYPVTLWQRLLEGGPEQRAALAAVKPLQGRLYEQVPRLQDMLFPNAFEHLYEIRTVFGYSALVPHCLAYLPPEEKESNQQHLADYVYTSDKIGEATGQLKKATPSPVRFQWQGSVPRPLTIQAESLNRIILSIAPGKEGQLLWTDTYYPGWRADLDGRRIPMQKSPPVFSVIAIPAEAKTLELSYGPRYLPLGLSLAGVSLLVLVLQALMQSRHPRFSSPGNR